MPDGPTNEPAPSPSPRAFCHATGLVFQSVGFALALGTCCLWPAARCWQDELPFEGLQPPAVFREAAPAELWAMVAVALTFVSGMALCVVGLGLQHDRRGSGRAAFWLTAAVAAFFWCYLGFAVFSFPAVGRIVTAAIMTALWNICFLLAGVSADQQKRLPPPRPSESAWTWRDEDDLRRNASPRSPDRTNP